MYDVHDVCLLVQALVIYDRLELESSGAVFRCSCIKIRKLSSSRPPQIIVCHLWNEWLGNRVARTYSIATRMLDESTSFCRPNGPEDALATRSWIYFSSYTPISTDGTSKITRTPPPPLFFAPPLTDYFKKENSRAGPMRIFKSKNKTIFPKSVSWLLAFEIPKVFW